MSAILLAACVFGLRPTIRDVSLAYGLHSYQQLAAELTDQGIPTRCEAGIRQRYALIRIPPTSWDSLRHVLESGLDVQFAGIDQGAFEIRKDPSVALAEESLFKRFSRKFGQTIQEAIQGGWEDFRQLETSPSQRGEIDPLTNMLDAIRSLPAANPDRNALSVAVSLKQQIARRFAYADLWDGIDVGKLLKGVDPSLSTAEQVSEWSPPDNPIGAIVPPPLKSFGMRSPDGEPSLPQLKVEQWRFDSHSFTLTKDIAVSFDPALPGFGRGTTEIIPDAIGFDCDWDELYKGLKVQSKFQDRVGATSAWLASKAATSPFSFADTVGTVSNLLSKWSEQTEHPILFEVVPNREYLWDQTHPNNKNFTVAQFFRDWSAASVTPRILNNTWTVEEVDGVTVVRNEIRFIDHQVPFNPEALIALTKARAETQDGLNSPADLIGAANLLTPDEHYATVGTEAYGVQLGFPFTSPYFRLIHTDQACLHAVQTLHAGQTLRFPLNSFSIDARRKFEKALRQLALKEPSSWSIALWPEFDEIMASSTVVVKGEITYGHQSIQLSLTSPLIKNAKSGLCPIDLGPVSLVD